MVKTKFWLAQLLMLSVIGLILGAPAFAKAPEQSKGNEMKNAHASAQAKSKANSNAGFDVVAETEPVGEEADTSGNTGEVDYEAVCIELFGSAAMFNSTNLTCINLDTYEVVQL